MLEHDQYDPVIELAEKIQHPVLWKIIAEHSLGKLDLKTANQAYGKSKDYLHVQFVKWLQKMDVSHCKGSFDRLHTNNKRKFSNF
jgi:hypothetical protein